MIAQDDLRAAIASGLLSEKQAASLIALADSRRGAREDLADGDEPFELFKGFNEIFIVIGMGILATGWMALAVLYVGADFSGVDRRIMTATVVTAAAVWLLSEYFIRRRRMVAPAIALSCFWFATAAIGSANLYFDPFAFLEKDLSGYSMPLAITTVATLVFWLRFRVPFAMALIAMGAYATALLLGASQSSTPSSFQDIFLLSADGPFAYITLGIGLGVFGIAMFFDMSDPHRVTRRSAQGFWLHLVAAPALVNTIALTLLVSDSSGARMALLAVLLVFAIVAIIIDRRSFLIAAVGYTMSLASVVFSRDGEVWAVLVLGIFLVVLGAFWAPIRSALLAALAGILPLDRLPPSH